ncbi:hypothetical protein [Streptomyces sp. NPDC059003]|uniref:hypothetical protein n=1 Tax=Streptomyces sp. NPDC059003 TaxID=3346691 RepID=UPI00367761A8
MPVTLNKTPRAITVLMQDGTVYGLLLTPATGEERHTLYMDAYWGACLDVVAVTAIDRYDAITQAAAQHAREMAIEDYAARYHVSEETARAVYRDCRRWATTLSPTERATRHRIKHQSTIRRTALIDVMRENGEPITA